MNPLLSRAALLLLAASVLAPLRAATTWSDSEAQIDETVADANTKAPINLLQPLLAQTPFSNFRYPHVDANEDITFIADDPAESTQKVAHHGIFRSLHGNAELQPLVRAGEAVPGTDIRLKWIRGLQTEGADFIFNATDSAHGRGLYHWSNGVLTTVARTGSTIVPGFPQPLTDVEWGSLDHGRVFYSAEAGHEVLIALYELKTGRTTLVSRSGNDIPGQPGAQFRFFSHQNWIDSANMIFRAGSVTDPHKAGLKGPGYHGVYCWRDLDWSHLDRAFDPARLITIADGRTVVPGLDAGSHFQEFFSAPVRDGLTGFLAYGKDAAGEEFNGMYYCTLSEAGKTLHPIVDSQSQMAGLFPGNFNHFALFPSVFDKSIAFVGYADGGYVGVFLYRTDRDELFLLCDNRSDLAGKKIEDFEIAGHLMVRDRFAIATHFADNTSGVYLATIPARSFKRMVTAK